MLLANLMLLFRRHRGLARDAVPAAVLPVGQGPKYSCRAVTLVCWPWTSLSYRAGDGVLLNPALPRLGRRADDAALHHHRRLCVFNDTVRGADRRAAPDAPAGGIIIPSAVVVRFFPTVGEDYAIRAPWPCGGIAASRGTLRHPVQSLEYILMPLLMNSNNVARDLSPPR